MGGWARVIFCVTNKINMLSSTRIFSEHRSPYSNGRGAAEREVGNGAEHGAFWNNGDDLRKLFVDKKVKDGCSWQSQWD